MKTSFPRKALVLAAGLVLSTASVCANAQQWNIPTRNNEGNYFTKNIAEFAQDIEKATSGKLKITIHPEDSLFKQPDVKRAVQTGQVQMGEILMSLHGNENKLFEIDSIPFLTTSLDESARLLALSRDKIAAALDRQGLRLLFVAPYAPNAFYTRDKVESTGDLKGVKFRAFNATTARLAELMGASPVTVQQAEVSQAFSTGVIQAMITAPATGVDTQAWDFVKNYYAVNAMITWNIVIVNKRAFDRLDDAAKTAVLDASSRAEKRVWAMVPDISRELVGILKKNGMNIHEPSKQLQTELREIGRVMSDEWAKAAGPAGREILDAYRASSR